MPDSPYADMSESPAETGVDAMAFALDFLDANFENALHLQQEFLDPEEFLGWLKMAFN